MSLSRDSEPLGGARYHGYQSPQHSEDFLEHLNKVKEVWPCEGSSDHNYGKENDTEQSSTSYGVFCTGEPAVDPSRQIQSFLDEESHWI